MSTEMSNNLYFLSGSGEMSELVRSKDWSKTSLGQPSSWPQSLRTSVCTMLENPFGMYIAWGKEYTQIYNDSYRPILGSTKHPQALGISAKETFAEIWHIIEPMFASVMEGKAVGFPNFMLSLNRNGYVEECYFDFAYSPIRLDDGTVGGVLVTVIETTARRNAEVALLQSEERFRAMADNIPNLSWMANADGWIYWYNKKWYDYTGATSAEMEGWGWQKVHDPEVLPSVLDQWQSSILSGEPFEMVFPLKGADGKFRQFLTRVLPLINHEGIISQWFGTNTDITAQKHIEQSLIESEARFRKMTENTEILIALSDEKGNTIFFNKAWIDFTGSQESDLLESGWANLIHPNDRDNFVAKYLDAFQVKDSFTGEFRILNSIGEYRWLLTKGSPRFHEDGSFTGYISSCIDITDRKNAENTILESENKCRLILEEASVAAALYMGSNLIIDYVNQVMVRYWGKDNSVIGKPLAEALPELEGQDFIQKLNNVFITGITYCGTEEMAELIVDGVKKMFYFNFTYKALRDLNGNITAIHHTAIDVTREVTAKTALRESEQNLRNTIAKAPVAMCLLRGSDYKLELANEQMGKVWGKSVEGLLNKPIADSLPEARNQGLEALLDGVYQTGITYSAEGVPLKFLQNGVLEDKYVNFVYEAYREADGTISGIIAVAVDVTAQVLANRVVEDAYERFKKVSDAMPQIVWTAKPDGNLDFFNNQWWEYSGLNFEQSVGTGWTSTIYKGDVSLLNQSWTHSLMSGEPYQVETRVKRVDGMYRWLLIRALPIKEHNKITQWVGTCTDIQDQKESEKELHNLSIELAAVNEELKASNEEIGDANNQLKLINSDLDNFIYTASHDLKAPISNIEGLMAALKGLIPKELAHIREVDLITGLIDNSIDRFKKTINQLTDITQLQKEFRLDLVDVSLAEVIKGVQLDLQILMNQMGATLEVNPNTDVYIYFSPKNLRSIIYNLVSNAIKYSSPDRLPLIKISCTEIKEFKIISIFDNGLGIDLSNKAKLFAMFGRLHDHVEGSGVGLYIVKKMVENAGGSIEVRSEVGVGSTFEVRLKNKK